MELFHRMRQVYSQTAHEELLGFMPPEPGLIREELSALDGPELATLYAEHITSTSVLQAGPQPIPPNMRRTRKPQQASPPHSWSH